MNRNLNDLATEIHDGNRVKGFYEGEKNLGEMIALIHAELSEALEADREDRYQKTDIHESAIDTLTQVNYKEWFESHVKDRFEDELIDVLIRVLDLAAYKKIDIERHLKLKMRYNIGRPYRHKKKY